MPYKITKLQQTTYPTQTYLLEKPFKTDKLHDKTTFGICFAD